jgi:hypothetical protein
MPNIPAMLMIMKIKLAAACRPDGTFLGELLHLDDAL